MTTFVTRINDSKCGSKVKRPYYLNEAMQFMIPFVKTCTTPSGNLLQIPNGDVVVTNVWGNFDISKYPEPNQQDRNLVSSPDMLLPLFPN